MSLSKEELLRFVMLHSEGADIISPADLDKKGLLPVLTDVNSSVQEGTGANVTLRRLVGLVMSSLAAVIEDPRLPDDVKMNIEGAVAMAALAAHIDATRRTVTETTTDTTSDITLIVSLPEVIQRVNDFIIDAEKATVMLLPAILMAEKNPDLGNVSNVAIMSALGLALRHQLHDNGDEKRRKLDTVEVLMLLASTVYSKLDDRSKQHFAPYVDKSRTAYEELVLSDTEGHTSTVVTVESEVGEQSLEEVLRRKLR